MNENFEKTIEYVITQIDKEITLGSWAAKLLKVWQESEQVYRALLEINCSELIFERELKLYYTNFQSPADYDNEIQRILDKYNEYTKAISSIKEIASQDSKLELDNVWKAKLLSIEEISPLETKAIFIFANSQNSFTKEFNLLADTFISLNTYYEELYAILDKLNTPIVVDYAAMVQNTTY